MALRVDCWSSMTASSSKYIMTLGNTALYAPLCAAYVRQRTEILNAKAHPAVCNQSDHNRAASFQTAR
jgi:hypothetical protein